MRETFIYKKEKPFLLLSCDSRGIQTHNLLIRSQMLYSVELGSLLIGFAGAKVRTIFESTKLFPVFFRFLSFLPSFFK